MNYEWDPAKAKANFAKHGVRFADAVTVLEVTLGRDVLGRLLVVVYTWRGESVRLISARPATARETTQYEEHHEA